jgi:exopolysaccharide biosynthesis polyprenyl glycosylphosphotransferase
MILSSSERRTHFSALSAGRTYAEVAADVANGHHEATVDRLAPLPEATRGAQPRRMRRGWLVRRMLLAADVLGLAAAFALTELLFLGGADNLGTGRRALIFAATLPVWILAAKLYGLYDRDEERAVHSTADEVVTVFHLITVGAWGFVATSWFIGLAGPNQEKLTVFWLLAILSVITMRWLARTLARRHPAYVQNTVIIGAGDVGQLIARKLLQHPEYRINLLGFVDATPKEMRRDLPDARLIGAPESIADVVERQSVDRVIVAFSQDHHEPLLAAIRSLKEHDVQIDVVPRLFEAVSPTAPVHGVEGLPLVSIARARIPRSSQLMKRTVDIVGAALLLVLAAPLLFVMAVLVRRDSKGPVFFRQQRLGIDMRSFTVLKFRTMREGTDDGPHRDYLKKIMSADATPGTNNLYKLERAADVTPVGRWLRKTSIDELPQLFNVLKGDMSLVGPRPAIPYELELYEPHHFERFLVPAGLTGLWQVEARAHSTFGEALDLDVIYARSWSLGLDLRLLLRTPLLMFRNRDTG